jgi:hypothetical protein
VHGQCTGVLSVYEFESENGVEIEARTHLWDILYGYAALLILIAAITPAERSCSTTYGRCNVRWLLLSCVIECCTQGN